MIFNRIIYLLLSSIYLISSTIAMDNNLYKDVTKENLVITRCNNICLSNNINNNLQIDNNNSINFTYNINNEYNNIYSLCQNKNLQIDSNNSINFTYDINKNFVTSKCDSICIQYPNNNKEINNKDSDSEENNNMQNSDNEESDNEKDNNPVINKNVNNATNNNEDSNSEENNDIQNFNNKNSDNEQNNPALNENIKEEQSLNNEELGEVLDGEKTNNNPTQDAENKSDKWDALKDLQEQVYLIKIDDQLNSLFNSKQFKIIENANKILLKNNINEIYNKFGVNEEILSIYKGYHSEILSSLNKILGTKIKDMPDATNDLQKVCDNILLNSYKKLHGDNDNIDIDEIAEEVSEEEIKSEHDLQGMNILKILTHLCVTIDDICEQNHAALHQALLSKMKNLSYFAKANAKLFKIFKLFGILEK